MPKISPQKLIWSQKFSIFYVESICKVLSIRGIKRAWVWQVLEFKQMNAYNTLLRCQKWVLKRSNAYLVSKVLYFLCGVYLQSFMHSWDKTRVSLTGFGICWSFFLPSATNMLSIRTQVRVSNPQGLIRPI